MLVRSPLTLLMFLAAAPSLRADVPKNPGQYVKEHYTKRAYQICEEREHKHGFGLDDWLTAEKELWRDDDLSASDFSLVVDCPQDPQVTTILSLTNHSLVVLRSRKKQTDEAKRGPDVQSVHQFSQEIDPAQTEVKAVNGTLRICLPKKNHATSR